MTPLQKLKTIVKDMIDNGGDPDLHAVITHIESLLAEEKQMVIDAYDTAVKFRFSSNSNEAFKTGEQYFNETFENTIK